MLKGGLTSATSFFVQVFHPNLQDYLDDLTSIQKAYNCFITADSMGDWNFHNNEKIRNKFDNEAGYKKNLCDKHKPLQQINALANAAKHHTRRNKRTPDDPDSHEIKSADPLFSDGGFFTDGGGFECEIHTTQLTADELRGVLLEVYRFWHRELDIGSLVSIPRPRKSAVKKS